MNFDGNEWCRNGSLSGDCKLAVMQLKNNWNGLEYQKQTGDICSCRLECATVFYCTQWVKPISRQEKMIIS